MIARQFSAFTGMTSNAKITTSVIIYCVIAATGGLMFGYGAGIFSHGYGSGNILFTDSFIKKFYPVFYQKSMDTDLNTDSNYCRHGYSTELEPFVYSFYLAAATATFLACYTTRRLGRRHTMIISGVFVIVGIILITAAQDLAMLFIGRVLYGCGYGFANQAIPIYLSEIAPTRIRGALNILFMLIFRVGILISILVSYGATKIRREWDWRLSMGLAGIPAAIFTIGSFFIVETPNSLIERGHLEKGKEVLRKIRGTNNYNIEPEILEIVEATNISKQVKHPFRNLLKRRNMPHLIIAIAFQIFHIFTGISTISIYPPVFLKTIGYDRDVFLYSALMVEVVKLISTALSMYFVDKIGRRKLTIEASLHMFLSNILIAIILGIKVKDNSTNISHSLAIFVVILIWTFLSSYAWSCGALSWLIASEIFPLETRSSGQSVAVFVHFLLNFIIMHYRFPMLCRFKFWTFLFFSGWIVIMHFFVLFFLPETNNIPIEDMRDRVWKRHWFWKRFFDHDDNADEERRP